MKKLLLVIMLAFCQLSFATTYIVDINGGGHYTSINAAIGVANTNDTVKVWPGIYNEQVTLNKNITFIGSGYENTIIIGNFNPIVTMSSGRMQWFRITSLNGTGINLTGGILRNCVVLSCAGVGIYCASGTPSIINCIVYGNGSYGIQVNGATLSVVNCISRSNALTGFYRGYYGAGTMALSYSNGSYSYTGGNQGMIDCDPMFTNPPEDFHISEGSCCWNTGNPSLYDPDGSQSDIGYFGGPDCPIYPVVTEIIITPGGNTINLQAKGRANY